MAWFQPGVVEKFTSPDSAENQIGAGYSEEINLQKMEEKRKLLEEKMKCLEESQKHLEKHLEEREKRLEEREKHLKEDAEKTKKHLEKYQKAKEERLLKHLEEKKKRLEERAKHLEEREKRLEEREKRLEEREKRLDEREIVRDCENLTLPQIQILRNEGEISPTGRDQPRRRLHSIDIEHPTMGGNSPSGSSSQLTIPDPTGRTPSPDSGFGD